MKDMSYKRDEEKRQENVQELERRARAERDALDEKLKEREKHQVLK